MKIGIVSSYFYPWYGGITEHVYYQYRELKRRGHDVRIITPFNGGGMLDSTGDLIRIGKPIPMLLNGSAVKIPLLMNGKSVAEHILSTERFDILHLHQPLFCVLSYAFLRRIRERKRLGLPVPKVVGTFHAYGGRTEKFLINRLKFYFRQFRSDFDHHIAVSGVSRDFIYPVLPADYSIIPNGVDLERFSPKGERIPAFDDDAFNILFVGRLEPRKGLTALMRSVPLIPRYSDKKYRLIVAGNGLLTNYYRRRLPREAARNVIFTGAIPFEDMPSYYRSAQLFCSPASFGESFGIVLIEAMAAGLPIVAGDNEGYRKVIRHGQSGVLVDPRDPNALAATIGTLMNSTSLRSALSEFSLNESKKYGWSGIIDMIENIYLQLFMSANREPLSKMA
jgi:phosphatidyl-myo-inositol alpha-mannosyltransferase